MRLRRDALAAAAEMMLAIEQFASASEWPHTVATVGRIHCHPNVANVIPAEVEFSLDVRDIDGECLDRAVAGIRERISVAAARRDIGCSMALAARSEPRALNADLIECLAAHAGSERLAYRRMSSGALHDAAMLTRVTDVGMFFVPSREGRSHTPGEWTDMSDIVQGTTLLLAVATDLSGA